MRKTIPLSFAALGAASLLAVARPSNADVDVLAVMAAELDRSVEALADESVPVYYLSYEITEESQVSLAASFGAISRRSRGESRILDLDLRVGSSDLDNTHPVRGDRGGFRRRSISRVPVSDPEALRMALWLDTERSYRQATERLARIKTDVAMQAADDEGGVADFSAAETVEHSDSLQTLAVDADEWAERLRRYSAPFADADHVYTGAATLSAVAETRWYVNSEGSRIRTSQTAYRLGLYGSTKAEDGMTLPRYEQFFAFSEDGLPDHEKVLATVEGIVRDLRGLRDAPLGEPYSGPAILSGQASGVFFHEILGHRVEGHRQRNADDAQTFRDMIGESVLPESFSVVFDPGVRRAGGTDLAGFFRYDNEGIRGERVVVIDEGVLSQFLMSRRPTASFAASNGHGRKQPGFAAVARQSNLFVQVRDAVSNTDLKAMLVDRVRDEGKQYGLLFDRIQGGFTTTGSHDSERVQRAPDHGVPDLSGRSGGTRPRGRPHRDSPHDVQQDRRGREGGRDIQRYLRRRIRRRPRERDLASGASRADRGAAEGELGAAPAASAGSSGDIPAWRPRLGRRSPVNRSWAAALLIAAGSTWLPAFAQTGVVMRAMRDEMARSVSDLQLDSLDRPYFIAYSIFELVDVRASASLGALGRSGSGETRLLHVEVRVGDRNLDNSNFTGRTGFGGGRDRSGSVPLPLEDDYDGIRRSIWLATDQAYKRALGQISRKRAMLQNQTVVEPVPDFSVEEPFRHEGGPLPPSPDLDLVSSLAVDVSATFSEHPGIHDSSVDVDARRVRVHYLNSEDSTFVRDDPVYSVTVAARTRAPDGMEIADSFTEFGHSMDDLPDLPSLAERSRELAERLAVVRQAQLAERYAGPVLFEGQAAAEVVRQVLLPRLGVQKVPHVDDQRMRRAADRLENPFQDRLGSRIMPRFLSVVDDPTLRQDDRGPLRGGYEVDDEGVPARTTALVQRGLLKTLLSTRNPIPGILESNGHMRAGGPAPSNLVVTSSDGLTDDEMREELLAVMEERELDYGIVVRRIRDADGGFGGGFRDRSGGGPLIRTVDAFKVYTDGREEPIRDGALAGLTERSFRDIVAASEAATSHTFLFRSAAGSFDPLGSANPARGLGAVATLVVPALLFEDVSLRRPPGNIPRPPALPRPGAGD